MKNIRILTVANVVSFCIHVSLSYLTQLKLVNPRDVAEVSDAYPSLFTPAPVTFAIWAVIYISLAAFCCYHLVVAFRQHSHHPANIDTRRMGGWFMLNNLATAGWLLAWTHSKLLLSLLLIFLQLVTLIALHRLLDIQDTTRKAASKSFTQFPLSIYLGWITIASIANFSVYLVSVNWNGFNWGLTEIQWLIIIVSVAIIISLLVVLLRRNVWYGLVIIWALYGIILQRKADNAVLYDNVVNFCLAGIGILATACLFRLIKNLHARAKSTVTPS